MFLFALEFGRSARFIDSTRWARSEARVEARLTTSSPSKSEDLLSNFPSKSEDLLSNLSVVGRLMPSLLAAELFRFLVSRLSHTSSSGESRASLSLGDSTRPSRPPSTCPSMLEATVSAARLGFVASEDSSEAGGAGDPPPLPVVRLSAETVCSKLSTRGLPVVASGMLGMEAALRPVSGRAGGRSGLVATPTPPAVPVGVVAVEVGGEVKSALPPIELVLPADSSGS